MSNWIDYLSNDESIRAIYGEKIPVDLSDVELMEVSVDYDRPWVLIRFNLKELPSPPPRKWEDANRVQITLILSEINAIRLEGLKIDCAVSMLFSRQESFSHLKISDGKTINIEISFTSMSISQISAHLKAEE